MIPTTASRKKLTRKIITWETLLGIDISDPPSTKESILALSIELALEF